MESVLSYKRALQAYTKTLLALLRVCTGLTYAAAAQRCGITRPMLSQWTSGRRPMPPQHEQALRQLLTAGIHQQREHLAAQSPEALDTLQSALIPALVALDGAVVAMTREYDACARAKAAGVRGAHEAGFAATPKVRARVSADERAAFADRVALPWLWRTAALRNQKLRALIETEATADVRSNVHGLLDYHDLAGYCLRRRERNIG